MSRPSLIDVAQQRAADRAGGVAPPGAAGPLSYEGLLPVKVTNVVDGQGIIWDAALGRWVNGGAGAPSSAAAAGYPTIQSEFGRTGGVKFKLAIPTPASVSYRQAYSSDWATAGLDVWQGYIDHAVDVANCNGVKLAGDGVTNQIDVALPRFLAIGDYAAARGMSVYIELAAIQNGGTQAENIAGAEAILAAIRGRGWQVIGFDVNNEINYTPGGPFDKPTQTLKDYLAALFGKVAAYFPGASVSASLFAGVLSRVNGTAADDWIPVLAALAKAAGLRFHIDWHPYAVWGAEGGGETGTPYTVADYLTIANLWKEYPIFLGEFGSGAGLDGQSWETVWANGADAWAAHRGMVGGALWRQDAYTDDGVEPRRVELLRSVRTLQLFDGGSYATSSDALPAGVELTTVMADLPGALKRLRESDANLIPGKVPVWRVVAEVAGDLEGGDELELEVVDGAGAPLGTGNRLAVASALADGVPAGGLVEDVGPDALPIAIAGTPPTVTTGGAGHAGEAFNFTGGRLVLPQIALPRIFRAGAWVKYPTSGSADQMLMGQWKTGGTTTDGSCVFTINVNPTNGQVYWYFIGSDGSFNGDQSVVIPDDGAWHFVEVGVRATGQMVSAVDGFAGSQNNFAPASFVPGDGVTPFTIGDSSSAVSPFLGLIDSPFVKAEAMPGVDYSTAGLPALDAGTLVQLPLDAINAGAGGPSSAVLATPMLPYPVALELAQVRARNATAARGTVTRLTVQTSDR